MKKPAILLFSLMLIFGCSSDKKAELEKMMKERDELTAKIDLLSADIAKTDTTMKVKNFVSVTVTPVALQTFNHFIEVQGKLDGEENVSATAQSMGLIKTLLVSEGDFVKKDQTLAIMNDDVMQTTLKQLQSQLGFVTDLYNRQKALWEQKIGSEVQYLSAKNNKEALENQIATLKEQIDMARLISPINGTVEEISIKVGQAVSPGLPLIKIINFSTAKVIADVSETYSPFIKKGADVQVFFPDLDKEINATLDFSSKFINPINRTFQVIVKFVPKDFEYRANMLTVLKINDYKKENTIVLPINYIQTENNKKYVYVAEGKDDSMVARKKEVKIGRDYNGQVEILEGLSVDEKVITMGFAELEDGTPVKI